ncbi:MAG: hypothetical protein ACUVRA_00970 [Candidatus Bathyarchaeaceae archaeon]
MHRKLKAFWLIVTLALISTLLLPTTTIPAVSADPQEPVTSVTYRFYDFFQGKMDEEVWGKPPEEGGKEWIGRWWWYGTDYVESWSYPVVYQRGSPAWNEPYAPYEDAAYWTNGRLNVVAENLPLNIDTVGWIDDWWLVGTGHRSFVPWNLTLGLGEYPGPGGYCNISWYMTYTGVERTNYWGWGPDRHPAAYPHGTHDGWFVEINGTLTMDRLGAMKVLGMNSTIYDNLPTMAAAWTAEKQPARKWWHWLESEGNWWPMVLPYAYNWLLHETVILGNDGYGKEKWLPYTLPPDWPWNLPGVVGIFDLSEWPSRVTVPIWITGWMLENLIGRWLSDWWSVMGGFMPFEGYYSDLHLDASIGPESTDLVLDTQVDWLLVASDGIGEPCSPAKWVFEPLWGDIPYGTHIEENLQGEGFDYPWSSGWHYYKNSTGWRKSYRTTTVGAYNYGGQNPYGYTPSAWNLGIDGKASAPWRPWNDNGQRLYYDVGPGNHSGWQERLIFDWSEIQHKGKIPGYHQDPWTILPSYNVTQQWGNLVLDQNFTWPLSELSPEQVIITPKTLTFIGPIDFAQLSWLSYNTDWLRLRTNDRWPDCTNGVLPWGAPIIYWDIAEEEIPICNPAIASSTTSKPVWTTNTRTSNTDYKYGLSWQYKGVTININAIVKNRGTVPCNFTVTASIETAPGVWTVIGSQPVTELPQLAEVVLVFPWNTATASACKTYRIKIEITDVQCQTPEDYIKDNVYILEWTYFTPQNYPDLWYGPDWSCMTTKGGAVKLKLVGDVNGDGSVTWKDLGSLGTAYGAGPTSPNWNPEADFDANDAVTWKDLGSLGTNYGKSC